MTTEAQPIYLIDNHANLHIKAGDQCLVLPPAGALELLKFLERTQFTQIVNTSKGATA
jgi:hypothetical protein